MNIGRAVGIVKNISNENVANENVTNEERALAIYEVMNMPTLNSVSKYELVKAMQWLWHQAFIFEDEDGADNGNELE